MKYASLSLKLLASQPLAQGLLAMVSSDTTSPILDFMRVHVSLIIKLTLKQ